MHSPCSQKFPSSSSQMLKHFPQCSMSSSVLTQAPPQISSPRPVQSPPVVISVVPVPVSSVVPLVWPVDDESVPDVLDELEVDVLDVLDVVPSVVVVVVPSEVEVDVASEVVGVVVSEVVGAVVEDDVVDTPFVLDIESVPTIDVLVVAAVVSPGSSPLQAKMLSPTTTATMTGATPWTWRSAAAQNGQRLSLSQT